MISILDYGDAKGGEGHLGADAALVRAFLDALRRGDPSLILTSSRRCTGKDRPGSAGPVDPAMEAHAAQPAHHRSHQGDHEDGQ
jgi:hypothetical protein